MATLLGGALFSVLDASIGLRTPGSSIEGGRQHALFFGFALKHGLTLGLCAGLVLALVQLLLGGVRLPLPRGRRVSLPIAVVALVAVVAFLWASQALFKGAWISRQSWREAAYWGFVALAVILVPAAIIAGARSVASRTKQRRWLALGWLGFGAVVLLVNASAYRNQYPDIHLELAVTAFGALGLSSFGLVDGSPLDLAVSRRRATGVAVLATAMVAVMIVVPRMSDLRTKGDRVRAAFEARAWGLAQLTPFTDPFFRWVPRADPVPVANVGELLKRLAPQLNTFSPEPGPAGSSGSSRPTQDAIAATLNRAMPDRRKMNIIWVALDTVRADHTGCLGYARNTTPVLDAFARGAFLFERAYTSYPTSAYAYSSVFSSLPARIAPHFAGAFQRPWKYPPEQIFPRLVKSAGFRTAAVTAFNPVDLESPVMFKSLRDGFDVFNPDQEGSAANAAKVTSSAIGVIKKFAQDRSRPFFLWVHYLDPHDPYDHHPQFNFGPSALDCYDSEIAWTDYYLGTLLSELADLGLLDQTVIAIFADHGEEFDEHGGRYHNGTVYEEQIRVPLALRVPGLRPAKLPTTVSLMDLVPTLTTLLDLKDPAPRLGRDLVPFLLGELPPEGGLAVSEVFTIRAGVHARDERAVVLGKKKLIHRVQKDSYELFDLSKDPGERESRVGLGDPAEAQLRGVLLAWNAAVDAWVAAQEGGRGRRVNDDIQARLDSLEKLTRPDELKRAVTELENLLVTGYGDPHQRLVAELTPPEIEAVFRQAKARYASLPPQARPAILRALTPRALPELVPFFREELGGPIKSAVEAALALALRDDPAAFPILSSGLEAEAIPDKGNIAWGLVRLGDLRAWDWLMTDLYSCRFGRSFREAIRCLQKLNASARAEEGKATPARLLRTRLVEEAYRHPEVNATIVETCRDWPEEDASLILLRLSRDNDVEIRRLAEDALRGRMTPEVLQRNRAAMDEELDADAALLNVLSDGAVQRYRGALEKGTLFNSGLRFRLARALHLGGKVAESRAVLVELSAKAPLKYDRKLAERFVDQLRWPLFSDDPKFQCTVLDVTVPKIIEAGEEFGVRFRLRNDGKDPWRGGWFMGVPDLRLRFKLPSGQFHETQAELNVVNHFDEAGVNPGETVDVLVIGVGMRGPSEGTLTLSFKNERIGYPNDGLIWKSSAITRVQ